MKEDTLKIRVLKTIWRFVLIIIGAAITAVGIIFFLQAHKLLSGGVTGVALLISYFTDIKPGYWVIVFNIPLFIMAWRKIDLWFCIYSVIGTALLSAFMIVADGFHNISMVTDPLLAAIFGGLLSGVGTGIVIRARASQGGTDIISVIVRKKYSIGIGMVSFYINIILVGILSVKFGLELGLLTIFAQYIAAKSLDRVVTGFNTAKAVMIVSDKSEEIAKYIMERISRGVTLLDGHGGYEKDPKKVIWCIVTTTQMSRMKAAMHKIDPKAFMTITDASEVIGSGFYKSPF